MATIEIFKNDSFGEVRVAGTSEEPLFCLADVCKAIGITNARNVKDRLDKEDVRLVDTPTAGGMQAMVYVTEAGMYDAVLKSDSPKARPFSRWITHEVLIALRKHGTYTIRQDNSAQISDKLQVATWVIDTLRLNDNSKLMVVKAVAEPYGIPTPDYTTSKDILRPATVLLKENNINMSVRDFNKILVDKGFLTIISRKSSGGKEKLFKSITEKGLSYGENQASLQNPRETQPLWYEGKFMELATLAGVKNVI